MKPSGICSRNGNALPLPRAGRVGVGVPPQNGLPEGRYFPHPPRSCERVDLPASGRGEANAEGATPMTRHVEVMDLVARLKAAEETFVLATVVRTVSGTAAKAGAKAIIRPDGTIVAGGIGGGRARRAGLWGSRDALAAGGPRQVFGPA